MLGLPDSVHQKYEDVCHKCLGEQAHWFCETGKCDVVELFSSNTGLSWHMSRMNMKVGEQIHHKHGWSSNDGKTKRHQVWNPLEQLDPEYVLIIPILHHMPGIIQFTSFALK